MSVIVGGTDPRQRDVPGPRRPSALVALVLTAVGVLAYASLPSAPAERGADRTGFTEAAPVDSGRWLRAGTSTIASYDPRRLGDLYVFVTENGVSMVDATGTATAHRFGGDAHPQRITSESQTAVVFGRLEDRPVLWTSTDGRRWQRDDVPWTGSVLAVAIRPGHLAVLGLDEGREVVGTLEDDQWSVTPTDAPDTGLWSTGEGIVGRGRQPDGSVGYFYSTDGVTWVPIGQYLSAHIGDVLTLHDEGGEVMARVPESGVTLRPPALPIVAYWDLGDRHWLQTQSAVWWSTDGLRWSPLPLDRAHGVMGGSPILLPFSDRALITVGGARGSPRTVYTWILGA
ncbi:MAG: hypothetical protein WD156_05655 [Acidimicrobiia bacterium]